jgi:lipopolysaccharide transport system permease protein
LTSKLKVFGQNRSLIGSFRQLLSYRELLVIWTFREIRARYRQSILGIGWAFVQPVFQLVVMSVIFGSFLRIQTGELPYPVFLYVALLPWSLFSGSISASVPSLMANMHLITKIYFPREVLPLSAIFARSIDFVIASLVFIILMIYYKIPLYSSVLYIPLLLLVQTILAIGIGLFGSAISVFVRDISFAIPMLMQLWMYATPVIYPLERIPDQWLYLYMLNPMVPIISAYRQILLEGKAPDLNSLGFSALLSSVFCLISYIYFKSLEKNMVDII